jgi:hypothetical protein
MLCTTVWNYASHFTPESCTQFLPLITLFTPVTACACHLHPPVRDAIPRAKPSASRTGISLYVFHDMYAIYTLANPTVALRLPQGPAGRPRRSSNFGTWCPTVDAPVYSLPPRYCTFDTRPTIVVTYSPCLTYSDLGCLAAFEATSLPGVRVHLFEAGANIWRG